MHSLNDYEIWKQRSEDIRREVERTRLVGRDRSRRSQYFVWELLRIGGSFVKLFRLQRRAR